jgi:hypothetical protein
VEPEREASMVTKKGSPALLSVDGAESIRAEIAMTCGQSAWATREGVELTIVNAMLRGRDAPNEKVLAAVGLKEVVAYARL